MTVAQELDLLEQAIDTIPPNKKYWLIRTQSGELYNAFRENNLVSLERTELPFGLLEILDEQAVGDAGRHFQLIKGAVARAHSSRIPDGSDAIPDQRLIGKAAGQIFKFGYVMKEGDVVVIPSANSDWVSFGIIADNKLASLSPEEYRRYESDAVLHRRVKWVKEIRRNQLDPNLYRMFTAQQAVNDVGSYAEVIERSLKDLFVIDDQAHLIVNVAAQHEIAARDLFGLGSYILALVDDFSTEFNLGVSSADLQVTINLNSPGSIDLKSRIKRTTLVTGIILATVGGGYEDKKGHTVKSPGLPALIEAVDKFLDHRQDREMRAQIFASYKDSLKVKDPDDMIALLKQVSDNRDSAR